MVGGQTVPGVWMEMGQAREQPRVDGGHADLLWSDEALPFPRIERDESLRAWTGR